MSGTLSNSTMSRPISSGVPTRRPVTAVDFGETLGLKGFSMSSRESAPEEENWFPEHTEASISLVAESDDDVDDGEKKTDETLRDMVLTANEYFTRASGEGNWWE